jgi:hypothetical protein
LNARALGGLHEAEVALLDLAKIGIDVLGSHVLGGGLIR